MEPAGLSPRVPGRTRELAVAPGLVEPLFRPLEGLMFELNFSSNADWLVAVLLVAAVVAAALV
jgi:hypothetical protein